MRTTARTSSRILLASLALVASVATALPAMAQTPSEPDQSLDATFRPVASPGPCVVLGGPTTIDFGQVALGAGFSSSPQTTTVTPCGPIAQDVRATVSDATGAAGSTLWTPYDCPDAPCITPPNRFAYRLGGVTLIGPPRSLGLGGPLVHQLRLPAPGSAGAGESVTVRVTILAVAS